MSGLYGNEFQARRESLRLPADPSWPKIPHRRQSDDGGDIIDHPCIVTLTGTPQRSRTIVRSPRYCQGTKDPPKSLLPRCVNTAVPQPEQPLKRRPSCMDPRFRKVTTVKSKLASPETKTEELKTTTSQSEIRGSDKRISAVEAHEKSATRDDININAQSECKNQNATAEETKSVAPQSVKQVDHSSQNPNITLTSCEIHESAKGTLEENKSLQASQKSSKESSIHVKKSISCEKFVDRKELSIQRSATMVYDRPNSPFHPQMAVDIPPPRKVFCESEIDVTSGSEIDARKKTKLHFTETTNKDEYPDADSEKDTSRDNGRKSFLQKRRTPYSRKNIHTKHNSLVCPKAKLPPQYSTVDSTDSEICPRSRPRPTYAKKCPITTDSECDKGEMPRSNVEELAYSTSFWSKDEFQKFLHTLDLKTRNRILSTQKRKIQSEYNIHAENGLVAPSSEVQIARHTQTQRHRRKHQRPVDTKVICRRNTDKCLPNLENNRDDTQTVDDCCSDVLCDSTARTPAETDSPRTEGTAADKPTIIPQKTQKLLNKSYWEFYNKLKDGDKKAVTNEQPPMSMNKTFQLDSGRSCDTFEISTPAGETLEHCSVLSSMINQKWESSAKPSANTIGTIDFSLNGDKETFLNPNACPAGKIVSTAMDCTTKSCVAVARQEEDSNQPSDRILRLKTVGLFGCMLYIMVVFLPMIYDILFYDEMSYVEMVGYYVYSSFHEAFGDIFDIIFRILFRPIYWAISIPVSLVAAVLHFVTSLFFTS